MGFFRLGLVIDFDESIEDVDAKTSHSNATRRNYDNVYSVYGSVIHVFDRFIKIYYQP
jgi:hypothetical protein